MHQLECCALHSAVLLSPVVAEEQSGHPVRGPDLYAAWLEVVVPKLNLLYSCVSSGGTPVPMVID